MRISSRIALLGALAAIIPAASASASTATFTVSPNKGGTTIVGAPTTFKAAFTGATAATTDGNQMLQKIVVDLPTQLVFNTIPFAQCSLATFAASGHTCPSSTKIGSATMTADGGPSVGDIPVVMTMYFGQGFTMLAHVTANKPAIIDEGLVGSLQSSGVAGYGLSMVFPVDQTLQAPLGLSASVFPTVKQLNASFKMPTKKVSVKGIKGKVTVPLAGLGPCKGKLPFRIDVDYTNAANVATTKTDTATSSATCKK
jgi:hypothetical protein